MITRARFYFGEDGDFAVDFNVTEGKRVRAVARTAAQLAAMPLPEPITVTTYGELFTAIAGLGESLTVEDVAKELRIEAEERDRRAAEEAKLLSAQAKGQGRAP